MKTVIIIFTGAFIFLGGKMFAQPANDNCATAATLLIPCSTPVNGSVAGATQSDTGTTCNSFTSAQARDVWYQFSALSGITYDITVTPSSSFDAVINLRSGPCGNQASVGCADDYYAGYAEDLIFTAPSTGNYFVRVYAFMTTPTDTPSTPTFTICAAPVGINEPQVEVPFSVFPNPSSGNINITINRVINDASLTIYNSLGEKTYADKVTSQGNFSTELAIKEKPGIYFLEIKDKDNRYFQKLIVQERE